MGRRVKVVPPAERSVVKDHAVTKARLAAMQKVAASFSSLRPASETLTHVRAVPTIFSEFDHAVRVGGLPIERFSTVHGPSNHGKTSFILGLIRSFLACDHFALFVDAERTTPKDWVETMVTPELTMHPGFLYKRPETYERTIADVREYCLGIADAKDSGKLPEDMSGIIVVDSIRKLVPKSMMKQIEEENDKGKDADPAKRAGQLRAAMNTSWLDELVPILERSGVGMVVITREMEDPDASVFAKKFGTNFKLQGGGGLIYDSSLLMRVQRAAYVTKDKGAEGVAPVVYGERHRITIHKTKVGGKDDKASKAYFHTSNGLWVPEGFDRARDVLELAQRFEIVRKSGASFTYVGSDSQLRERAKLGVGEHNAVKYLSANEGMLEAIDRECRANFANVKPPEADEEAA